MSGGFHLIFESRPPEPRKKTDSWDVLTIHPNSETVLGVVRWYSPWRRYTFQPAADTIYDTKCLNKIANFCAEQTLKRKRARALEKGHPPCFSYCKREVPHAGECVPMEGR